MPAEVTAACSLLRDSANLVSFCHLPRAGTSPGDPWVTVLPQGASLRYPWAESTLLQQVLPSPLPVTEQSVPPGWLCREEDTTLHTERGGVRRLTCPHPRCLECPQLVLPALPWNRSGGTRTSSCSSVQLGDPTPWCRGQRWRSTQKLELTLRLGSHQGHEGILVW